MARFSCQNLNRPTIWTSMNQSFNNIQMNFCLFLTFTMIEHPSISILPFNLSLDTNPQQVFAFFKKQDLLYRLIDLFFSFFLPLSFHITAGDHPFECEFCGSCFRDESTLKGHKRIHTGEKPYECNGCGKKFSLKHQLETHYRVHTGTAMKLKLNMCKKSLLMHLFIFIYILFGGGKNSCCCCRNEVL